MRTDEEPFDLNLVEIRAINVETPQWVSNLEKFCLDVMADLGQKKWDVSLLLCDNEFIRDLNKRYRNMDNPTDVLTFPQQEMNHAASHAIGGDIVISMERSKENAIEYNQTHKNELKRLVIHGMLHLYGMDHTDTISGENGKELSEMLALQERILRKHSEESLF